MSRQWRRAQQIQRGFAEVAPDAHAKAGARSHATNERRHRALAVSSGDADDRRVSGAGKQLDVANNLQPTATSLDEKRLGERNAGRSNNAVGTIEQPHVEATDAHRNTGIELSEPRQLGRLLARVSNGQPPTARMQIARAGKPCAAKPHDHSKPSICGARTHLSFNVANPANTSSREMIQNRTITFGSGQPLSSKW
jgi:hypothetical protein